MQKTRSTFSLLFYINTSKAKKSGKCPILGRISIDGKNTAFSTGIEILPADWDADRGMATGKDREIITVNRKIDYFKSIIKNNYQSLLEDKGYVTAESLKNALQGVGTNKNTVMQEFMDLLNEKSKSIGIIITDSTMVKYQGAIRHFRNFLREKLKVDDITFSKFDIELIESYVQYMKVDLRMSPNTARINIKPLRTVALRAVSRKLLLQDPFFDYRNEKIPTTRKWISIDELESIMKVDMGYSSWNFNKDMFIFACFTGISYADLYNLKHSNIHLQSDGNRMIIIQRQKTGVSSCIPLLPVANGILEKYRDSKFSGWGGKVFRMQTLTGINLQLKSIAKAANMDKRLTFHMGRHTYSTTICLSNGVPIESLSRMLGHSSISTTQIYAEVTRTKINEDMTNLEKRIEGKYQLAEEEIN